MQIPRSASLRRAWFNLVNIVAEFDSTSRSELESLQTLCLQYIMRFSGRCCRALISLARQAWTHRKLYVLTWRKLSSLVISTFTKHEASLRAFLPSPIFLTYPSELESTPVKLGHVGTNIRAWTCSEFGCNILPPQKFILGPLQWKGLLTFSLKILRKLCP